MKIFGDSISGNCLKVKWTADLLGLDYKWIETSVIAAETRTDEFLKINPAGQVPCVVVDEDLSLAQSNAIMMYLAETNDSALLPSAPFDRAKVYEWMFWEQYSHEPAIAVRRFQKSFLGKSEQELGPALLERGNAALARMEKALERSEYLVSSDMTLADIALVAYTRMAGDGGSELSDYPALTEWIGRVEKALGLEPYPGTS